MANPNSSSKPNTKPKTIAVPGSPHPLVFDPAAHRYTHAGRECISVTTLVGKFKKPFDADFWAGRKAKERGGGCSASDIKAEWDAKRDASCELGTAVHEYAEECASSLWTYDENPPFDDRPPHLHGYCAGVQATYRDHRIQAIHAELMICEPAFGVAGTVDLLADTTPQGDPRFAILDWKTNADIEHESRYNAKMLAPLSHLADTNYWHYALQLSIYRVILERLYGEWLGGRIPEYAALIHLTPEGGYCLIEVPYLRAEAVMLLSMAGRGAVAAGNSGKSGKLSSRK